MTSTFIGVLADWPAHLWPAVDRLLPGTADDAMLVVGDSSTSPCATSACCWPRSHSHGLRPHRSRVHAEPSNHARDCGRHSSVSAVISNISEHVCTAMMDMP